MSSPGEAPGLLPELSAFDLLMHRGEANPRTRSGIMALEILDTVPEWAEFRRRFDNASRKALRLRQRVVVPPPATLTCAAKRSPGRCEKRSR